MAARFDPMMIMESGTVTSAISSTGSDTYLLKVTGEIKMAIAAMDARFTG